MRLLFPAVAVLALCACSRESTPPAPATPAAPAKATVTTRPAAGHAFDAAITAADFAYHVQTLASDEFEGRAPGTHGEELALDYLKTQFERLGLAPAANGSYLQAVPMVSALTLPESTLALTVGGKAQPLKFGDDVVFGSRQEQERIALAGAPLVFAGYGVTAPAWNWDDYAGLDVKGKIVVVLINDPGFARKDPELFNGPAMTYFGRWTYKFEEAARHGAAGCLIVHDEPGAAYAWSVVRAGWVSDRHFLPASADSEARVALEGWLSGDAAKALFDGAGLDLEKLRLAADQRGFKPQAIEGATLDATIVSKLTRSTSYNAIAVLPGTTRKDEVVAYSAHWDHLGRHEGEAGDDIYNGARDNASGVAGVLEIAEAFVHADPKPARSVLFLVDTLEESGLLGTRYYTEHPLFPLEKTVAEINLDDLPINGRSKDMIVIGYGQSTLDDLLGEATAAQGRRAGEDPDALRLGFYYRSDHFNFARRQVPVLYARGGPDLVNGGVEAGRAAERKYIAERYHKPADEFDPKWDMSGVIEDLAALQAVGAKIASGDATPSWKPGAEFAPAAAKR